MGFDMPRDEEPDKEEYEKWEKERPGWNVGDDIFFLSDDETKVVCCKVIEVSEYGMVSEELPRLYPDCQLTISSSLHPKAFHRYEDAAARALRVTAKKMRDLEQARRNIVSQAKPLKLAPEAMGVIYKEIADEFEATG